MELWKAIVISEFGFSDNERIEKLAEGGYVICSSYLEGNSRAQTAMGDGYSSMDYAVNIII